MLELIGSGDKSFTILLQRAGFNSRLDLMIKMFKLEKNTFEDSPIRLLQLRRE
jgi:hypothetical protein